MARIDNLGNFLTDVATSIRTKKVQQTQLHQLTLIQR